MNKKLTREEILKMPAGREMDVLIAKVVFGNEKNSWDWEFTLPSYSTNISAAWGVIDAMCEKYFRYEVGGNFMGLGHKYAYFDNENWADNNPPFKAFAETTPLAICRAALLAVMESE